MANSSPVSPLGRRALSIRSVVERATAQTKKVMSTSSSRSSAAVRGLTELVRLRTIVVMVLRSRTNPVRDGVPDPVQERSNGAEPLQALVHKMVQQARLPSLCIAVTRGSGPVYLDAFGAADLATSVPATTSTRYLWFSMTKL